MLSTKERFVGIVGIIDDLTVSNTNADSGNTLFTFLLCTKHKNKFTSTALSLRQKS